MMSSLFVFKQRCRQAAEFRAASRPYVDNATVGTLFRGSGYFSAWERPPCIFLIFLPKSPPSMALANAQMSHLFAGRVEGEPQAVISAHRHQRMGAWQYIRLPP